MYHSCCIKLFGVISVPMYLQHLVNKYGWLLETSLQPAFCNGASAAGIWLIDELTSVVSRVILELEGVETENESKKNLENLANLLEAIGYEKEPLKLKFE